MATRPSSSRGSTPASAKRGQSDRSGKARGAWGERARKAAKKTIQRAKTARRRG